MPLLCFVVFIVHVISSFVHFLFLISFRSIMRLCLYATRSIPCIICVCISNQSLPYSYLPPHSLSQFTVFAWYSLSQSPFCFLSLQFVFSFHRLFNTKHVLQSALVDTSATKYKFWRMAYKNMKKLNFTRIEWSLICFIHSDSLISVNLWHIGKAIFFAFRDFRVLLFSLFWMRTWQS